jgi:hypothetical protein
MKGAHWWLTLRETSHSSRPVALTCDPMRECTDCGQLKPLGEMHFLPIKARASAASRVDVAHAEIAGHVNVTGRRSGSPMRNVPVRDDTPNGVGSIADAGAYTSHLSRRWDRG